MAEVLASLNPVRYFGPESRIFSRTINLLLKEVNTSSNKNFYSWHRYFGMLYGYKNTNDLLFCLQTYYLLIVKLITARIINPSMYEDGKRCLKSFLKALENGTLFKERGIANFPGEDIFGWYLDTKNDNIYELIEEIFDAILKYVELQTNKDVFRQLYQRIIPATLRHKLGEYYTPLWLAEKVISEINFDKKEDKSLLDPACGSGTFLITALTNLIRYARDINKITSCVIGVDINPVAVLTSKANYILTLADLLHKSKTNIHIPVYCEDAIRSRKLLRHFAGKFDYIVGNPPWINWEDLSEEYRNLTNELWKEYGLFTLRGAKARLGSGKHDLSTLMTYIVADRYLKKGGIIGFIMPQSIFKASDSAEGFRRLVLPDAQALKIIRIEDFSNLHTFNGANSLACVVIMKKGERTTYPICYNLWFPRSHNLISADIKWSHAVKSVVRKKLFAEPAIKTKPDSCWIVSSKNMLKILGRIIDKSDYRARAGVCSWANSIYWVKVIKQYDGMALIQNYAQARKYKVEQITTQLEGIFLFPLVRGRDIKRWGHQSQLRIILPYSRDNASKALGESYMKEKAPLTYAYLKQFEEMLSARKGYQKYCIGQPFYAVYDVGPYTFKEFKVCWKFISSDMCSAVVSSTDQGVVIPDLNVIFIPADTEEEAHYICACLNSSLVRFIIKSSGLCIKISPWILQYVPIKKFESNNPLHKALADLSRLCHQKTKLGQDISHEQRQIDILSASMWNIKETQIPKVNLQH